MFLNDQEDSERILTTYRINDQPATPEINTFSWTIITVQHLDTLSVSNKHNGSFWIFTHFFFFIIFKYALIIFIFMEGY